MIRGRVVFSTLGAAMMVLAGCAARVPYVPLRPLASYAVVQPPDLVFHMRDGFVLPARVWRPPAGVAPAGVILALHGFTDSRDAWEMPAPGFAASGYTVVAPDQRGFGATADRGVWAGEAVMVGDAAELASKLRARFPGQRLIVMGESMGGAIAMCLAARAPHAADAFVLLSPAVWGRGEMDPAVVGSLWAADAVAPGWKLTGEEIPLDIAATDNIEALVRLSKDPLTLRGSTVAMLSGLVDLMGAAQAASARLPPETLVLNGRRDQVVPPAATAKAWAKLPDDVRRGLYLSGYHLLLRDQDRALVQADILAWLAAPDRWLPSGADINAAAWQSDHAWDGAVSAALPAAAIDGVGEKRVWPF